MTRRSDVPNKSAIRILMRMVDDDLRLVTSHGYKGGTPHFESRDGKGRQIDLTRDELIAYRHSRGDHDCMEQVQPKDRELPWYLRMYRINDLGRKFVAEGRAEVEAEIAKKAAKNALTNRLVIIQNDESRYSNHPIFGFQRRICGLFSVTRETENRLYGILIRPNDADPKFDEIMSDWSLVHGRGEGTYISRSQIVIDPATEDLFEKLFKIEHERYTDLIEKTRQMDAEMAELQRQYQIRAFQSRAMYADMFREAGLPLEVSERLANIDKSDHEKRMARLQETDNEDLSE